MADKKISALPAATTPLAGTEVLPIVQGGTTDQVSVANLTAARAVSGASFNVTGSTPPTNGICLPAANSVGIATNGSVQCTVDATGNFGFGTSGQPDKLFVYANTASSVLFVRNDGAGPLQTWATFGTTRMQLSAAGNLTVNTGNLVVGTAGKGIDFSANTHATGMTKEVLDWYEEGTYTPTVTSGTGTITSYTATALYTRIGRQVTVNANIVITDAGTGTGVCTVTLPFANNGTVIGNGTGRENAITGSQLQASIGLSASTMDVRQYNNATVVATNAQIRVTATYFV